MGHSFLDLSSHKKFSMFRPVKLVLTLKLRGETEYK